MRASLRHYGAVLLSICGCGDTAVPAPPPPAAPETLDCAPDADGDLRVFAVGHHFLRDDAESYETYAASYLRHMDLIAPCIDPKVENLIVFPEATSLIARSIGSRGEAAREATSSKEAEAALDDAYQTPAEFLAKLYPEISDERATQLASSDVVWRALSETFGTIADDYGVWVAVGAELPRLVKTTAPHLVSAMQDPDIDRTGAVFFPDTGDLFSTTLLFDPQGELAGRAERVFVSEALAGAPLADVAPIATPFGDVAFIGGHDAMTAPVLERLDDLGAELIIQPAGRGPWVGSDPWGADAFLAGGWQHTQAYGAFRHNIAAPLCGNYFDDVFDGQAHITRKAAPDHDAYGYVGQTPIPGFLAVGDWSAVDPTELSLSERRTQLADAAEALAPGGDDDNGYRDSVVVADVTLDRSSVKVDRDSARPESFAIAKDAGAPQRLPAVASDGADRAVTVWQHGAGNAARIYYAVSDDGGATWSDGAAVYDSDIPSAQRRPTVCMHADGRTVIGWQSGSPSHELIYLASLADPTATVEMTSVVDLFNRPQFNPVCAFTDNDEVAVAWVDMATGIPRMRYSERLFNGPNTALASDESSNELTGLQGAQWGPTIAPGGHIVWLDYRESDWGLYYARWTDALSDPVRIDGIDDANRFLSDPSISASGETVTVTFTDRHGGRDHADIGIVSWTGAVGSAVHTVVPSGPESEASISAGGAAASRFRPVVLQDGAEARVFFQDLAPDKSALFSWHSGADKPLRFDDTADAPVSLTRPAAARVSGGTLVVWEDDRGGATKIYATRVPD